MTRDGLRIGREYLLDVSTAECCICGRRLYRGWRVRAVTGRGQAHSECAKPDPALEMFGALFGVCPAQPVEVHREMGTTECSRHWVAAQLREVHAAGLIRRAGRYYRPSRAYPTPEALFLAWAAVRPRIGRKPLPGSKSDDPEGDDEGHGSDRAAG